jgi:hypothetical protein
MESMEWRVDSMECQMDSMECQMDSMECQMDSIPFPGGFHGMVDGFHIFSRWIPYPFQGGVHMESM